MLLLLVLFLLPNGQSRAANGKGSPCGDTWVCQVVIALWEITQATTCTAKKEIKADHEPECPVLGAFRQCLWRTATPRTCSICTVDARSDWASHAMNTLE